MLCPEVWKFNYSSKTSTYQAGKYDVKAEKIVDKTIRNSHFNKMVSLILPECDSVPESIQELINGSDFYLVRNLSLYELLCKDFVEAFVKRGYLTAISLKTDDSDEFENKINVTPDGQLNLLICKDLYQSLGLEGRPIGKSKQRFEITIDLKNSNIFEHPKLYNRLVNAISNSEIEQFDLQLTWKSIDSTICPSSIAKFFQDAGHKVEQHSLQIQWNAVNSLGIPNEVIPKGQLDALTAHQIAEYFAFVMLECELSSGGEELNSYRPSLNLSFESDCHRRGRIMHLKGLMSSEFVEELLEKLRLSSSEHDQAVIMSLTGEELPANGYAGQTFVLLNDQHYFLFKT